MTKELIWRLTPTVLFVIGAILQRIALVRSSRLLHQERVTVAMACSALKNVPDGYDDRHAFISEKLADINARVSRRPK